MLNAYPDLQGEILNLSHLSFTLLNREGRAQMENYCNKSADEIKRLMHTPKEGLDDDQVQERLQEYGYNELKEKKGKSVFLVFLEQFKDFLVIILITAAIVSGLLGELASTIVILVVITLNSALGTLQHIKSERSIQSLKKLSSPNSKVLRNNKPMEVPSREIVPGDILYLEAGDYISADGRIIECHNLKVNESALTGEAEGVVKTSDIINETELPLGDRTNMIFSGSFVVYGRAVVIVTGTGMNTEIGKIAGLLESTGQKKTPLQITLDTFGKRLAIGILIICGIIFAMNLLRGGGFIDSFMFAVSLAVAAIPEALSSIVTIVLSIGTQKMAKENAIVRKLHAVESLGSTSVICSDKTGTLTQNRMSIQKLYVDEEIMDKDSVDIKQELHRKLITMGLLCSDAVTLKDKSMGDPTEIALLDLGEIYGLDEEVSRNEHPRLGELPFDSDRKLMSTVNDVHGNVYMITKGAVDVLMDRVESIETSKGIRPITDKDRENIRRVNREFSNQALRVLAFAYKPFSRDAQVNFEDEKGLTFIGLMAMLDPPRKESKQAVEACIHAGIKPIMITGDHKLTASAIARMIGILNEGEEAMEGKELDKLTDEQLKEVVDKVSVYARVSPEHKIRIVKAWQDKGKVVAMTGDGVNDAPALNQADIGVAMGITGTEVAKEAASMVLTDDNFSTIVSAISSGRSIYENIKNAIGFLLSGNAAGIITVLYTAIRGLPNPFTALQLLFINLITDSLPAIAIGLEPYRRDVMNEKPRNVDEPILNRSFMVKLISEGMIIAAVTISAYHIGLLKESTAASTMAFSVLCLGRLFHGLNSRSMFFLGRIGLFTNMFVWYAIAVGFLLLQLILRVPYFMRIFGNEALGPPDSWLIYLLAIVPVLIVQLFRLVSDSNSRT